MPDAMIQPELERVRPAGALPPVKAIPSLSRETFAIGIAILILFASFTCVAGLRGGPAMGDHECIVAQSARQCVESGNWLIPYLGEIPRIRKTPVGIWSVGLSSFLFDDPAGPPVSDYSARMPSAIAGVLNALIVCWLGTMLFGRRVGLVAGFIAAGCVGTVLYSRNAQVDMILTMFTTLSFALFWRGALSERPSRWAMIGFYVVFAAAMMAKGPLPAATVAMPLFLFWFGTLPWLMTGERPDVPFKSEWLQQCRRLGQLWLIPGLILFCVLAAAWPLYAYAHVKLALHLDAFKLWKIEYADRFSGDLSEKHQHAWYYIPLVFGLTAPYMLSLPESLVAIGLRRYRCWRVQLGYVLTWALVGTVFISSASYKRPHYLLSMIPAYCLLLAPVIDRLFFGKVDARPEMLKRMARVVPVVLAGVVIAAGIFLRKEVSGMVVSYALFAGLAVVAWSVAAFAFAQGRRSLAFAAFQLAVPAAVALGWPAAGIHLDENPEVRGLVAHLQECGVTSNDAIYWVGGRPDSSLEFYSGYRVRRLVNELEMAEVRSDRRTVDEELYRFMAERIRQRLAEDKPVYLIMASGHYEMLRRETDIKARVLFELKGFHDKPGDELLVATQAAAGTQASR